MAELPGPDGLRTFKRVSRFERLPRPHSTRLNTQHVVEANFRLEVAY